MYIRPLTSNDESFLRDVLYHAIYVPPGEDAPPYEIVREPELARYVTDWMKRPEDLGFAAEENGELIGAAWLRRWPSSERGFGFVDENTPELTIAMLPQYRGCGAGTELLRCLVNEAAQRYGAVSLSVAVSNPALRLYQREGFIAVGEPEDGSITMVRRFSPLIGA